MSRRRRQNRHEHLVRLLEAARPPTDWPGVADPSLARPDTIKFEYAEFASGTEPGESALKQFETDISQGPLGNLPDIRHWAMEEFFWHGLPGGDWHPMEAYLTWTGDRFPSPAQQQLRRWKEARFGLYEIGDISDGTLGLQEWDVIRSVHCGPAVRAITLNIAGIKEFRRSRGWIAATYLAPWSPERNIFCGLGYSVAFRKARIGVAELLLGLRQPGLVSRPYPWKVSRTAGDEHLRQWQVREWHGWLAERLEFPFRALAPTSERGDLSIVTVSRLLPTEPAMTRAMGIYFEARSSHKSGALIVAGATSVLPLEVAPPNWMPIAEYHAYRQRVGPPPGTRGRPSIVTFD